MTECLTDDIVRRFVQGTISAPERDPVERHLGVCPGCRRVVTDTANAFFETAAPSPSGMAVSRYLAKEIIGAGGLGIVYAAYDPELKRKVALKLIWAAPSGHPGEDQARLLREAQAMARLSHPHVVNVYDAGTFNGKIFIVMELVEGPTLQAWLAKETRPWREILDAFLAAGRGLAAAHAAQLVHRDFKPENVLVGADGRPRVTDFGLAADRGAQPGGVSDLVGTPAYMAPEQFLGKSVDARTDQFSFCVALYMALYGQRPFESGAAGTPRRVPEHSPVPAWMASILERGLQARPEDRHDSMNGLLEAIDRRLARDAGLRRLARFALVIAAIGAAGIMWQWAVRRPVCGNGVIETGEQCDGKNRSGSDGCLPACRFATCGDGVLRAGVEDCDDGNQRDGDGCTSHCSRSVAGDARVFLAENGHWYMRYDRPSTWQQASALCRRAGAHLATFDIMAERRAIYQDLIGRAGTWYWIGFHDPSGKGNYVWATDETTRNPSFRYWTSDTPQIDGGCVTIQKEPVSSMLAIPCESERGFICETDAWVTSPQDNHAYHAFGREMTWEGARDLCRNIGAHLLTISSNTESAFVHARFPGSHWVGAVRTTAEAGFLWITGEAFAPSFFAADEPDLPIFPACAVLGDDLWLHDRNCDGTDRGPYGVICERD